MTTSIPALTIERLGSDGDGLARDAAGRLVVVPFALPGEVMRDGAVTGESADRATPPCPHFTVCGGCVAQHVGATLYADWKRDLVGQALRQNRIETEVVPLVAIAPRSRRRASFSVVKTARGARLGYHKRRDAAVLALEACPVITPKIEAALGPLAALLGRVPGVTEKTRLAVADLDGGLDVLIEDALTTFSVEQRADLATLAAAAGVARLTIGRETLVEHAVVSLPSAAGSLRPPPGAFFQAVGAAESAIIDAVVAGLPKKTKRIADLFAGLGTLTLPLAKTAPVSAFDSDKTALAALDLAARQQQGLKVITTRYRDLIGEPLSVKELEPFDVVVLDPPRAGAKMQSERLAASAVKTVVMVSCNPQSLARDARTLVDGGFRLDRVTPIDQFLWSAHVEAVGVFRR